MRRASRSIPSNIAEGYGRAKSHLDVRNFLKTSLGSNDEMLFNLEFCKDARLFTPGAVEKLIAEYEICGKQLTNLIKSIPTSN